MLIKRIANYISARIAEALDAMDAILMILDGGLRLYRRNFAPFVLIGAVCLLPLALAVLLSVFAASRSGGQGVLVISSAVLFLVAPMYLIGGLSRATTAAAAGGPVRFRAALSIHPLRAAGMGCFTTIYSILMLALLLSFAAFPLGVVLKFLGALAGYDVEPQLAAPVVRGATLLLAWGVLCSLMYGFQPLLQEPQSHDASKRSWFDPPLGYRIRRNTLAWCLATLVISAAAPPILAIGVFVGKLVGRLGIDPLSMPLVLAGGCLFGLFMIATPMVIWMTLLYQHNRAAYDGADLAAQITEWQQQNAARGAASDLHTSAIPRTILKAQ
jgi:hypothetical protein